MEQTEKLIFDTKIKLRNNKKQLNENSIYTLIWMECKSLRKNGIRGEIADTH